eukprot:4739015-Alexandrium_andersonii.AAC.1
MHCLASSASAKPSGTVILGSGWSRRARRTRNGERNSKAHELRALCKACKQASSQHRAAAHRR